MFIEKKRAGVSPMLLIANGTSDGIVTVSDARGFFVKQTVFIASNTQQPRELEIKRFISKNSFRVGPKGPSMTAFSDISDFQVSENANISAPEQNRPGITDEDYNRAKYVEEPVVADRVIHVDEYGQYYNQENPFPISFPENLEPIILNIPVSTQNDDVLVNLPEDVRRFRMKLRDGKGPLRIYNESGNDYYEISKGSYYDSGELKNSSLSVRVQSSQGNAVLEVICWVLI